MKYISFTPNNGTVAQAKYRLLLHAKILTGWQEDDTHLMLTFRSKSIKVKDKDTEWTWRGEKSGIEDYKEVLAYLVSLKLPGHPDPGSRQVPDRKVKGYGLPGSNQPPLF